MTYEYNEESKAKMLEWAEVLESGKYRQIRSSWGSGHDGEIATTHCCLNVALVEFTGKDYYQTHNSVEIGRRSSARKATRENEVKRFLAEIFGQVGEVAWANHFIQMNDILEYDFPQIAAEIRKMVSDPIPSQ